MSEKNDYNVLEEQIGDAGSTDQSKSLGKIKHKEVLGQMGDLSPEDQASLDQFKKNIKKDREKREEIKIGQGWIPVNKEEMGKRALFYPNSYEFYVRPATVLAIKNWTSVDDTNSIEVNNVLNEILKSSVKVVDTSNEDFTIGWGRINSWDRFWFIMKVREATFAKGESKVDFTDVCSECGEEITYTLTSDALYFDIPDEDLIEKHWNGTYWDIDPKEYDVDHDPIKLYTPTCQKDDAIIRWAQASAQAKRTIDEKFIKFLIWMMPKPLRDNLLDDQINKIYKEYKGWSAEFFNFMDDVVRNLSVDPSENLSVICPSCERRSVSTVRFPNGIKKLFTIETAAKKFGSR